LPARYLVTDVDKMSDRQKEYLSSFNYPQLWSTSIHETYPGHFVQGAYLKQVVSPVRKVWALAPASFVEGWAHYTEQMMLEEGFANGDPKIKMGQLADALSIVQVRSGHPRAFGMTWIKRLDSSDNAFMGETSRIEAERGTFDPTYGLFGPMAILKLPEDYKRDRKKSSRFQKSHDRLLSNSNAPLWVHRQMLLPGDKGKLME
jgi:hypothetical protein